MMELDDRRIKVESEMKTSVGFQIELERHIRKWIELKESGEKFLLEIDKGISVIESLANKFTSLEAEKIRIESEINVLKQENTSLDNKITKSDKENCGKSVVDWIYDEEDTVTQLMIENKVLECEKKSAESMVEDLKSKCRRLELENSALIEQKILIDKSLNFGLDVNINARTLQHEMAHRMGVGNLEEEGTPSNKMASGEYTQVEKTAFPFEAETCNRRRVNKQLVFVEEESPRKKISPATPGIQRCSNCVVDISDSEDDQEHSTHLRSSRVGSLNRNRGNEDNSTSFSFASTHKRKRASNIVASDSESAGDYDNIPISNFRNKHLQSEAKNDLDEFNLIDGVKECSPPRRRLMRKCVEVPRRNSPSNSHKDYRNGGEEEDANEDETYSSTESETLGGFIVSGSDISENNDDSSVSHEVVDDDANFEEVISKIKRKRENKEKWEFEADMLADFGKDIELCMKAVCALYRQQTSEEKFIKSTICFNQRGFSQCDAPRGSDLAEFICDGDPDRDICKSAEELQKYDLKAPELCRTLATHYSKQLFAIYKNEEDPLFLPS